MNSRADSVIILDFETTGLSPDAGDRAIEIGAVRLEEGVVVDEFQALMNPGRRVSAFIEGYTSITNEMLAQADSCAKVMTRFADFIAGHNLIAHNASFDKKFLDAELNRLKLGYDGQFGCSLLVARRVLQDAYSYKLAELVDYLNIDAQALSADDGYHRALYDAQMTAKLWQVMLEDIGERYNLFDLPFEFILKLAKTPKKSVHKLLSEYIA